MVHKFKNSIKAFKKLRKEYKKVIKILKSGTILDSEEFDSREFMYKATGFGTETTCTLCTAVRIDCTKCLYFHKTLKNGLSCMRGKYKKSYRAIEKAENKKELIKALITRRKVMKKTILNNRS